MSWLRAFLLGALVGTFFGGVVLSAVSHILITVLVIVGVGALAAHAVRRRLPSPEARKDLHR